MSLTPIPPPPPTQQKIMHFSITIIFLPLLGILKLLKDSTDQVDGKEMIYSMALTSVESKMFYFFGIKYVHLDEFAETGLRDTTTLFVTIYEGKDISGEMVAEGVLYMRFKDFAKQLSKVLICFLSIK